MPYVSLLHHAECIQLVENLRIPLQTYYARLASPLPAISPGTLTQVRTVEDLLLAHLTFKCLVKLAFWAYHRYTCCKDYSEYEPWVRLGSKLLIYYPILIA